MSHYTVHEWGQLKIGGGGGEIALSHGEALHAAACAHPSAHEDGTNILVRRHDRLVARQMVGMISAPGCRSEEHTSELQSLMRISYAVFCLNKNKDTK